MEVVNWVQITIELYGFKPNGETDYHQLFSKKQVLSLFDIPRESYNKRKWFFTYKLAFWQVQHPKNLLVLSSCFYDRKTGLELGYNKPLSNLISAKAQRTKWKNKLSLLKEIVSQSLFEISEHPQYNFIINKISYYDNKILTLEKELGVN